MCHFLAGPFPRRHRPPSSLRKETFDVLRMAPIRLELNKGNSRSQGLGSGFSKELWKCLHFNNRVTNAGQTGLPAGHLKPDRESTVGGAWARASLTVRLIFF